MIIICFCRVIWYTKQASYKTAQDLQNGKSMTKIKFITLPVKDIKFNLEFSLKFKEIY